MSDEFEAFEKQIIARKEQLNLTKSKLESLKKSIISELQRILPQFIDRQLVSIVEYNADVINEISTEKLDEFKKASLVAKENAIKRVIDELLEYENWVSCEKTGIGMGGDLWNIIRSIEKEFLPLFADLKFQNRGTSMFGSSDLAPLNLTSFQSEELEELSDELIKISEDYCGKEDGLNELQKNIAKKKALEKWHNA